MFYCSLHAENDESMARTCRATYTPILSLENAIRDLVDCVCKAKYTHYGQPSRSVRYRTQQLEYVCQYERNACARRKQIETTARRREAEKEKEGMRARNKFKILWSAQSGHCSLEGNCETVETRSNNIVIVLLRQAHVYSIGSTCT